MGQVAPLGMPKKVMTDKELMKIARDNVKIREAKRLGVNIEDPSKLKIQIKSLGHNVCQVVAQV